MSTQTLTIETERAPLQPPEQPDQLRARHAPGWRCRSRHSRWPLASACQAVLYLGRFGTNIRTDGFFVAFALYSTFGVFSQSLRLTSVPLLVGPDARLSSRQFAFTIGLVALPVLIVTGPLAHPLAQLIAPGLAASGRSVTASALPVLGVAMVLQLWAAGGATVLAIRDRFLIVAGAYIAGSAAGLIAFLALMNTAGEQTLGWSMLSMAVVTSAWMTVGVQRSGGLESLGERFSFVSVLRDAGLILGRTAVYLAFNVLFVDNPGLRQPLRGGRHDGALLRLPVRQLPGRRDRNGAGHVEHPGHDTRRPNTRRGRSSPKPSRGAFATR